MFAFTVSERVWLTEQGAITTDDRGREVLVGLNFEQTAFYMDHSRRSLTKDRECDLDRKKEFLEFDRKHELARVAVQQAMIELANEKPPLQ